MKDQKNIIVVGLGHQSVDDHLPAIQEIKCLNLVGVVDIDLAKARQIGEEYGVSYSDSVEHFLGGNTVKTDIALVAVPHNEYLDIIRVLAKNKTHIIKEKPFALSVSDAKEIMTLIDENNISIQVTLQRRFNPIFLAFKQLIKRIGTLHSIEARYTLNIADLSQGWRAKKDSAGGGAIIDMGYHYIDLLIWYFGFPDKVKCRSSTGNRENQNYDVEDTAFIDFTYLKKDKNVHGSLLVSRIYPEKTEGLTAYGNKGCVRVRRGHIERLDNEGNVIESLTREAGWPSALIDQLEVFTENIIEGKIGGIKSNYLEQTAFLQAAYDSAESGKEVETKKYIKELQSHG